MDEHTSSPPPNSADDSAGDSVAEPTPTTDGSSAPTQEDRVDSGAFWFCIKCGYDLGGLSPEGQCPECGEEVRASLRRNHLANRPPWFAGRLRRGLGFVLYGILAWLALIIASPIVSVLTMPLGFSSNPGAPSGPSGAFGPAYVAVTIGFGALSLLVSLCVSWGWWLFTVREPDEPIPAPPSPDSRMVLRVATIALGVCLVLQFVGSVFSTVAAAEMMAQIQSQMQAQMQAAQTASGQTAPGAAGQAVPLSPAPPVFGPSFVIGSILGSLAGLGVLAAVGTAFFSSMYYVRWLSPRLPDAKVHRLSKSRMISCPIWATVGILIIVGPLIALVLYWNLLNLVYKHLKRINRLHRDAGYGPTISPSTPMP